HLFPFVAQTSESAVSQVSKPASVHLGMAPMLLRMRGRRGSRRYSRLGGLRYANGVGSPACSAGCDPAPPPARATLPLTPRTPAVSLCGASPAGSTQLDLLRGRAR